MKPLPEESAAVGVWVRPICHGGSGDRPWQILPWSIPNSFFFFLMTETIQTWEIFSDRGIGGSPRLVIQNEAKQLGRVKSGWYLTLITVHWVSSTQFLGRDC